MFSSSSCNSCYFFMLCLLRFGFLLFGPSVPCPCVEGGDDGLHCGGGVKDTELVLVVVAALSGAVRAGCDCGGGDLGTLEEYKCEILFVRGGRGAAVVVV
jgi:hypothetical protein